VGLERRDCKPFFFGGIGLLGFALLLALLFR
jgi:hypothetical protein